MKRLFTAVSFGFCALAVNPMVACQNEEGQEYSFDEAQMRQAVAGSYVGTVQSTGESVRISIEQTGLPSTRSTQSYKRVQCGTRSFVKPAAACLDSTTMEITAHITSDHAQLSEGEFSGNFEVYGFELSYGHMYLEGQGGSHLSASFSSSEGGLLEWHYSSADSNLVLELTRESAQ